MCWHIVTLLNFAADLVLIVVGGPCSICGGSCLFIFFGWSSRVFSLVTLRLVLCLVQCKADSHHFEQNCGFYKYSLFRLFNRAEYLERLVNDEVTDINEILTVINTIQV